MMQNTDEVLRSTPESHQSNIKDRELNASKNIYELNQQHAWAQTKECSTTEKAIEELTIADPSQNSGKLEHIFYV